MKHLDLFSGIGGFAYAADRVWHNVEHTFCDNDKFCRQVIKKHWPESFIYEDVHSITKPIYADLVTGGFPCQPFSQAGKRAGTADDRYLWPEMLRVIRLTQPSWVIAENVSGLLTMQGGMVFEQVCTDLEAAGYTVQPFIIPAAGVGAPHKRDRVWICAYANSPKHRGGGRQGSQADGLPGQQRAAVLSGQPGRTGQAVANSGRAITRKPKTRGPLTTGRARRRGLTDDYGWDQDWPTLAAQLCSVDDGLPVALDGLKFTKAQHRTEQIKAYGNAIVPEVALEIMRGIASYLP